MAEEDGESRLDDRMAKANKHDLGDYDKGISWKSVAILAAGALGLGLMVFGMYAVQEYKNPKRSGQLYFGRESPVKLAQNGIEQLESLVGSPKAVYTTVSTQYNRPASK